MDFLFALLFWFFGSPDGQVQNQQMPVLQPSQQVTYQARTESLRLQKFSQLAKDRKNLMSQNIAQFQLQNSIIVVEDTHFKPTK